MEISVYLSKSFANETSKLFRVSSIKDDRKYILNTHGENILRSRKHYDIDYSTETSLKELYELGWKIKTSNAIQNNWMMFFLERD